MSEQKRTYTVDKARSYEQRCATPIDDAARPLFHLSPYVGWMNDPNGFSYYEGAYHLFYQYHPYSTDWGPMHWGHAVSEDLLRWKHLPCALAPDSPFDNAGCFSGSAVEMSDGRQLLMYTGVVDDGWAEDGTHRSHQAQCVAFGDGRDYVKYEGNPVIPDSVLPESWKHEHFRDPKAWCAEDGTYRCVVGAVDENKDGYVLLFSSPDALTWSYEGELAHNGRRFGTMWECPDVFELDGKTVLLTSPQDMLVKERERLGGGALYCIGKIGEDGHSFVEDDLRAVDYGVDFYAPQTMCTPDGRRVMVAWMQSWDTTRQNYPDSRWYGQMTVPRELHVRDGRLYQQPVREVESLRRNKVSYQGLSFEGTLRLEGIEGRCADMTLRILPGGEGTFRSFSLHVAEAQGSVTVLSFDPEQGQLSLDRRYSGSRHMVTHQCSCDVSWDEGPFELRVLLDRYSIEVFANEGERTMTMVIPSDLTATGISFHADGEVVMDVEKYDLDADADGADVR